MIIAIWLIRIGVASVMLTFGIHELFKPGSWVEAYMPKFLQKLGFISPNNLMRLHSLGNIFLGGLLLSSLWAKPVTILTLIWWISILPFVFAKDWYSGMRDLAIIISVLALIFLL